MLMHFLSVRWQFQVAPSRHDRVVLMPWGVRWNDFGYRTLFTAYWLPAKSRHLQDIGLVKILQRGTKVTALPMSFERLTPDHCSLGQTSEYYSALAKLGTKVAREILEALGDLSVSRHRRSRFRAHVGVKQSLLRSPEAQRLYREMPPLLRGRAPAIKPISEMQFVYRPPVELEGFDAVHEIPFIFKPRAAGLGRAIALVGANGTGKTAVLAALARGLSGLSPKTRSETLHGNTKNIESVIAVSYSAFDTFRRPKPGQEMGVPYTYVGLRTREDNLELGFAFEDLKRHLSEIEAGGSWPTWKVNLRRLGIPDETPTHERDLAGPTVLVGWARKLSSGHKIALMALAALTARLRPGALALLDEPELHLHPTLLSRLMRVMHALLELRHAFAVVATHSPLVIQSIPAEFVRIIRKEGAAPYVRPYQGETFGENLTEIVNQVFDVGEEDRNYVHLMRAALEEFQSPKEVRDILGPLSLNASLTLDSLQRERARR